ncbi:GGDEF domain-containing protein [Undibacterium fentianense]|uniref:diguanylate cyclase n=1 Tax=Undibacterium fentianense TaxID=2828728 RepID=A0A941E654_9BURK|nr:GGDEF domain-containing protein [Undibacterium fentianense]MBR7800458.1 GGDEF domain-containing protein [Undibacterium fentianense]
MQIEKELNMLSMRQILYGKINFIEGEEYRAFQFRFLNILMLAGVVVTSLLLVGVAIGANTIDPLHVVSMSIFLALSLSLWLALRGRPQRFLQLAWVYECVCMCEYISALYMVSADELRVIWFFTNIPGVYILLGQRAGLSITLGTMLGLALGNAYLPQPYSINAMATLLVALFYLGTFFHVYGARSISYFVRMRESNQRLRHLATHDPLTDLLNAGAYYASCDQLIHLAQRNHQNFSVLFVDLDHFKKINDTYGHEAGDHVLKSVTKTIVGVVRHSDAVGRIGGEEFSVFLPDTDLAGALKLAELIRHAVENLMPVVGNQGIRITTSIGVATSNQTGENMAAIQRRADQAMYDAKQLGRNRVSCFTVDG